MQKPQIIIDSIEVNIKAPQQLHIVRPHSARKSSYGSQHEIPQTINQQNPNKESQDTIGSSHKIRHIESVEDKAQFVDQTSHSRISQKDQARETISRAIHPQVDLPLEDADLQKITEEVVNQEENSKPLKHIDVDTLIDRDEFNLKNSRQKSTETRKRRLSQTNAKGFIQQGNLFGNGNRFEQLQKPIPQKTIEEQGHKNTKQKSEVAHRRRKSSLHSAHQGVSEEIRRMIVDELDKKKKVKEDKNQDENDEPSMQEIKQEKQQDDSVNVSHLEQARQKIQGEFSNLSKVTGSEIGPQEQGQHLYMHNQQPIQQEAKEEKEE